MAELLFGTDCRVLGMAIVQITQYDIDVSLCRFYDSTLLLFETTVDSYTLTDQLFRLDKKVSISILIISRSETSVACFVMVSEY